MGSVLDLKGRLPYVKSPDKSATPENVMPKQPKNFPKMPAAIWDELGPQLLKAGLLTNVDGVAFALLCRDISDLDSIESKLDLVDNWVDETPNKFKVQSVWLNIRNRLHDDIIKLCKEFGMTPAARSTLKTNTGQSAQRSLFDGLDDGEPSTPDPYADFEARTH